MKRPIYETDDNRKKERTVADKIEKALGYTLRKLPIRYGLDYAAFQNDRLAKWFEIKGRTNPRDQYPTYMISLGKFLAARSLFDATGVGAALVVQWTDSAGLYNIRNGHALDVRMGGRTDRGDRQDIEPTVHINVGDFIELLPHQPLQGKE